MANESNCFLALDDNPSVPNLGDWFLVLGLGEGQFDDGILDGAGREAVRHTMTASVNLYSLTVLDQAGQHGIFLTDASAGLLKRWRDVLDALVLFDPIDETGVGLLCEPVFPTTYGPVLARKPTRAGWRQNFRLTFEWDLSSDEA